MARALAETKRSATDWAAEFARLEPELRARGPSWLAELRRAASEAFASRGFPSARDEAWRYTNVAPIARTRFAPSSNGAESGSPRALLERHVGSGERALALVFVDGRYVPGLSAAERADGGVRAGSLATFLVNEPQLVEPYLGKLASLEHPFAALNTALFRDGAFVRVPRGIALERPLHVLHVSTRQVEAQAVFPRALIVLEESAQATLVESHVGAGGASLSAALTEVHLTAGAVLDRYELAEQSAEAFHVALTRARVARGAVLRSHQFAFGAAIARTELDVELAGEGAECELNGLYVLDGERRAECRTTVDHALPRGTSRQDYRGILAGRSRGAFAGSVLVRPAAQKSDARQHNRNLLLSRDATADTKPELRIEADDVKCAHGATIGRLDEAQAFYLRARGIGELEARRMLTRAFASAVVDGVRPAELKTRIEALLDERLASAHASL